jgi:hypothetical protein
MHRLRSRSIRALAFPALAVPLALVAVLALPGMASAKAAKPAKAKPASCTSLSGNTSSTVSLGGCSNGGSFNETGGSGTFTTFSLNPAGGANTITWASGAVTHFNDTPTVEKKDKCAGEPTTIEAKLSGTVTSNTNLPTGNPGVKNPVKGFVCATPSGTGFQVKLLKGTFKV